MIPLPAEELFAVIEQVLPAASDDEGSTIGMVRLSSTPGEPRRWYATDSRVLVTLSGDQSRSAVDALLSPRLFPPEVLRSDDPLLEVPHQRGDGSLEGPVRLHLGDGVVLTQPARPLAFPDCDDILRDAHAAPAATATLSQATLLRALEVLLIRPRGSDPDENPPAFLEVADGRVTVRADWPGYGRSEVGVVGDGVSGRASVAINPAMLRRLTTLAPANFELRVPLDWHTPVCLVGIDQQWNGLLMPMRLWLSADELTDRLMEIVAEDFGLEVQPDTDGDLPIPFEDLVLFARTVEGEPAVGQVFSVLSREAEPTADLMERLNDLNASVRWVRVFHTADQVLCEAEVSNHVDADELRRVCVMVADATRMVRGLF